jgi:hypothetical protein
MATTVTVFERGGNKQKKSKLDGIYWSEVGQVVAFSMLKINVAKGSKHF